jgi:hypothetical protein
MNLDPDIWGPHYWFFLHTLAYSYPATPNAITKRKYYDCIHNLPLFIPHDEIGNKFSRLLDKYPVTPYLDKRESFLRWVNFIHNKVNYNQGKEEVSFDESVRLYKQSYSPKSYDFYRDTFLSKNTVYSHAAILSFLCLFLYIHYSGDT